MANGEGMFNFSSAKWIATDQIDGVIEYLKAIDWTERWLIALMVLHVLTFLLIFFNRNRTNLLVAIFALLLASVYFSEKLNSLAAANWRLFANEQYFDSPGLFISVVFSTPMLFNCLIIIRYFNKKLLEVIWLLDSSRMMLTVTRHRRKRYQRAQLAAAEEISKKVTVNDVEEKKDK